MLQLSELRPLLPPREPAPENAWSRDLVITLVAWVLCFVTGLAGAGPAGAMVSALIAIPLVVRRHFPLLMLYGSAVAALCQLPLGEIQFSVVVVPFVIYQVARWVQAPNAARLAVILGAVGSVLGPLAWTGLGSSTGNATVVVVYCFTCMVTVLTAYVIGRRRYEAVRSSDERKVAAETTLRMQLAASEQRARAAEVNERNRIARELHDIVAHSLSVIVVQAEGGRALASKKPELAADVLDTIAETSRESLVEMRRIVGVLRHGPERGGPHGEQPDWKPAPGLADLTELVARTTPRATLDVRGRPPAVSPTLGLTVYRIVQEALTNMLKHAGPDASARVVLDCTRPGVLGVSVADDGRAQATGSDGRGNGLRGMRERVQLVGGRLLVGPRPGGGFEVRATFPLVGPRPGPPVAPAGHTPGVPPRPAWARPPVPPPAAVRSGASFPSPGGRRTDPVEPGQRDPLRGPGGPETRAPADGRAVHRSGSRSGSGSDAGPHPDRRPAAPATPADGGEPTISLDATPTVHLDPDVQPTQVLPVLHDRSSPPVPRPERGRP